MNLPPLQKSALLSWYAQGTGPEPHKSTAGAIFARGYTTSPIPKLGKLTPEGKAAIVGLGHLRLVMQYEAREAEGSK